MGRMTSVGMRRKGNFISLDGGDSLYRHLREGGLVKSDGADVTPTPVPHPASAAGAAVAAAKQSSSSAILKNGTAADEAQARAYAVRAVTEVEVLVLAAEDMRWAVDHDYRLESELHRTVAARRKVAQITQQAGASDAPGASQSRGASEPLGTGMIATSPTASMSMLERRSRSNSWASSKAGPGSPRATSDDKAGGAGGAHGGSGPGGDSEENKVKRFKYGAGVILDEYFACADVGEAAACLGELDAVCGFGRSLLLVKRAVSRALDRGDREREMVAVLLSALSPGWIDPGEERHRQHSFCVCPKAP